MCSTKAPPKTIALRVVTREHPAALDNRPSAPMAAWEGEALALQEAQAAAAAAVLGAAGEGPWEAAEEAV